MKIPALFLSLLLASGSLAQAAMPNQIDEFTTLTGRTYRQCRISQVHPDGVSFFHSKGAAKVLFADVSDSWKKKLGYNPKLAEDFAKEVATRKFIEQDRIAKARAQAAAQASQNMELRLRIIERAMDLQMRQQFFQQQQLAAYYGSQFPVVAGPAPFINLAGGFYDSGFSNYGHLNPVYGPAFGGRPWNNCGSVTLASVGGGSGGYLGFNSNRCVWIGRGGAIWNYPTIVNSPTLGAYIPGRNGVFGGGYLGGGYLGAGHFGGGRSLGQAGLGSVAYGFLPPAANIAPVFRGSVSVSTPAPAP